MLTESNIKQLFDIIEADIKFLKLGERLNSL